MIEIVPVRIRENLVVRIAGIPWNLSKSEASRVARVVRAFATPRPRDSLGRFVKAQDKQS